MRAIFIRHGEPDYSNVMKKGFKGLGMELGELSLKGIAQAEEVSKNKRLRKREGEGSIDHLQLKVLY